MKKLLLLALVMLGGVVNVSATNVKRKIIVEFQDNMAGDWNGWKDHRYLYAWYYDGSDHDITNPWAKITEMTWVADMSATSKAFSYDLEADELVFENQKINIILTNKVSDGKWDQIQISDIDFSDGDYFVTIYKISNDGGIGYKNGTAVEYYLDEYGTNTLHPMTYSNGLLSTTYTSNSSSTTCVVAPNYALNGVDEILYWGLVYRTTEESNKALDSFENYDGDAQNSSSGNVWDFCLDAKFDVTLDVFTKKCSMHPFIESTVTTANVATFSSAYAVAIPAGLTASYATGVEGNTLTTTAFVNGIPANTGALLIPNSTIDETTTYKFTPAASTDAATGNKLVASVSGGAITWTDDEEDPSYYNYILTTQTVNGDAAPKFYLVNKTSGNTVSAGRAYLQLTEPAPARGYFSLWGDEPTSIEKLTSAKSEGVVYDLQGRKVAQPTKGLYIVNGKKVVLK